MGCRMGRRPMAGRRDLVIYILLPIVLYAAIGFVAGGLSGALFVTAFAVAGMIVAVGVLYGVHTWKLRKQASRGDRL